MKYNFNILPWKMKDIWVCGDTLASMEDDLQDPNIYVSVFILVIYENSLWSLQFDSYNT